MPQAPQRTHSAVTTHAAHPRQAGLSKPLKLPTAVVAVVAVRAPSPVDCLRTNKTGKALHAELQGRF